MWTKEDLRKIFKEEFVDELYALQFEDKDEDEDENLETLRAEAEQAQAVADLLKRHDAGSLKTLFKR